MSQQPQSAKRMRSNTSNDFTPQTAPALRGRLPQLDAEANVDVYNPAVYNGSFAAISPGRPDVTYGSYTAASQHNGYPSAAYGESYDPHAQTNSYTIAYGQPPPSNHTSSHGGLYTQSYVSNAPNGSYSPVTGRHSSSAGPEAYTPSPILGNSTTATYTDVQGHSATASVRQSIQQQYGEVYSTHPVAHNTSFHDQIMSYPETAIDPHYTPPIGQTAVNGKHHSPELPHEEDHGSDEDAQGETADEAEVDDVSPQRRVEDGPSKPPDTRCACKKGRGKKKACTSCACSKYGRRCGKHCSCGSACGNPFQDLTAFFGSPAKFPKPCDANACFATWLSNQPNIEELDLDLMVDMLLYDDTSWATIKGYTKAFKSWEDKWLKAKNAKAKKVKEDRQRLEFELLRGALGNCNPDDFHGFWYSFCRGQWVPMDHWEHCRECRQCASSTEWHCEQHAQCTTNGACAGCMGNPSHPGMTKYPVAA